MQGSYTITCPSDAKGAAKIIEAAWVSVFSVKPAGYIRDSLQLIKNGIKPKPMHLKDESIRKAKPKEGFDFVRISDAKHLEAYDMPDGHMRVCYRFVREYDYHINVFGEDIHGRLDTVQMYAIKARELIQ